MTGAWTLLQDVAPRAGWERRRVGDLVELSNGFPFDSDRFGPEGTLPLVRIRDLFLDEFTTYVSGPIPDQVVLRDGDLVIGMDGDFELAVWRRGPAALNQRMCLLRPRPGVDARFVAYALPRHLRVLNDLTYATTVKHLSSFDILSERILCPSDREQQVVADFLDAETAQIDAVVENRRQQLSLLEARRSSVVIELATGRAASGADAVMRFPAGWTRTRLRFLVEPPRAGDWGEDPTGVDDTFVVRAADFDRRRWRVDPARLPPRSIEESSLQQRRLVAGDLVLEKSGGGPDQPVGAIVSFDLDVSAVPSNFAARLRPAAGVDSRFLCYALAATYETGLNQRSIKQTTGIQNLDTGAYLSEAWAVPPYEEQVRIRSQIDSQLTTIDLLEGAAERQIHLLLERRHAVIVAAVTGLLEISGVAG